MASSSKYQQLISNGQAGTDNYDGNNCKDTSLQPYYSNSDSLSHSNISAANDLSVNKQDDGSQYHSIESYNKNSFTTTQQSQSQSQSQPQQSLSNIPGTPTRRGINDYTRSSSPIPVLLRSASSILSQSMRLPPGSLRASTFTVITGMVGGGTFTFSYGIYKSGMIPGLIYLIIVSSLAGYTTYSIVWCAEQNNCPSFRKLAKKLYSNKFAMFIQICLSLLLWMACISYMTLTKNLLHSAIRNLLNSHSNSNEWYDNDILLLLIASIIPTYLALQRKVSALRYASLFGLIVVLFSMCLVFITYMNWCNNKIINDNNDAGYDRKCFDKSISNSDYLFNKDILGHTYTIALFFGGFAAQFTVLPIYFEMQKRSPQNMKKCISSGFSITFVIYLIVAYFGYFTFPNLTDPKNDQNLITLYKNDTAMLIVQILMALYVMSIIPLFAHAFRKSINELIYARIKKKKKKEKDKYIKNGNEKDNENKDQKIINVTNSSTSLNNSNASLPSLSDISTEEESVNDREIIEDAITNPHLAYVPVSPEAEEFIKKTIQRREKKGEISHLDEMELPTTQHAILTLLFLASVFGVAIFAQNIGQVNSIISSTTLPIVCFIFPAMCTIKTKGASLRMKVLTSIMATLSFLNAIMFFYNMFINM